MNAKHSLALATSVMGVGQLIISSGQAVYCGQFHMLTRYLDSIFDGVSLGVSDLVRVVAIPEYYSCIWRMLLEGWPNH